MAPALVLDAADADAQFHEDLRHLFPARLQLVHGLLGGGQLLLQPNCAGLGFGQGGQNPGALLFLLGVLLFDALQLEHDRMHLAFQIAAFGRQRVDFALFRGERDFFRVQIRPE